VFSRSSTYDGSVPVPLSLRFPLAVIVILFAARTNRPAFVPVGSLLALPDLWFDGFSMLLGVIPLLPWDRTSPDIQAVLGPLFNGRPGTGQERRATGHPSPR
jgi:hypothetical protein